MNDTAAKTSSNLSR